MQFIETINVKGTEYQLQATYDSQGNDIAATYAKFTEVEGAISQAIGNLIGQAPEALNTLEELFSFRGDILINNLYNSGLFKFDDVVNDMDFFNKLKYTINYQSHISAMIYENLFNCWEA